MRKIERRQRQQERVYVKLVDKTSQAEPEPRNGCRADGKLGKVRSVRSACALRAAEVDADVRVPLEELEIETVGVRADDHPKKYESLELIYRLRGPAEEDQSKIDRAIELSKDKYCSVLHTLDPNVALSIRSERI